MPLEKLGPYKLEKVLGRGGMGTVYVGLHEETGERAAVKVLSGHLADDEAFRERFQIEVETLKRLSHPNIVQLSGFGEDDGHLFYVMELIHGRSLHDELAAGRRFTWREVTRIGILVAQALKHAHDRGIIHRDLKPANLLIDDQDHIKLTDFGIAKLYGGSSVTADGGVLGTADYMAPEQAEGKQVTARCDLYSLGSVLYALLTGRPPFAGKTIVQVITALKTEKPIPVRRLAPDAPEELENIIQQLLEKEPQQRIPTALVLMNRLKAMEHALSLDTRVMHPEELDEQDELRLAPEDGPAHQTQPLGLTEARPGGKETRPAPAGKNPPAVPAPGTLPTTVTGLGGGSARPSTATQATEPLAQPRSIHSAGTLAVSDAAGSDAELPPERKTHFTRLSDADLRTSRGLAEVDESSLRTWLTAGLLLLLAAAVIGSVVFVATRQPSADQLYGRVKAAMDEGGVERLATVQGDLSGFLEHFPEDARAQEVQDYQQELDLYQLQRRFELRARRPAGVEGLSPVERAYLEAVQLIRTNPEQALARFQALVDVYGGPADPKLTLVERKTSEQCLELAEKQIERLRDTVAQLNAEQQAAVRQQLDRAAALAGSDRAAAEKIWHGIVTLYSDKPWAKDLVAEAQAGLMNRP
jgi:serine/threonine-protein kinase